MGCSTWGRKESGTTKRLTLTYLHTTSFRGFGAKGGGVAIGRKF